MAGHYEIKVSFFYHIDELNVIDCKSFVYQKAFIPNFRHSFSLQNNFSEFTTCKHKFKRLFCTKKNNTQL